MPAIMISNCIALAMQLTQRKRRCKRRALYLHRPAHGGNRRGLTCSVPTVPSGNEPRSRDLFKTWVQKFDRRAFEVTRIASGQNKVVFYRDCADRRIRKVYRVARGIGCNHYLCVGPPPSVRRKQESDRRTTTSAHFLTTFCSSVRRFPGGKACTPASSSAWLIVVR